MKKRELSKHTAAIENQFVLKAHYKLTSSEQKLIYFLICSIDPKQQDQFYMQTVKIKELVKIFTSEETTTSGRIYERLDAMCINIASKPILVPIGFRVDGVPVTMHEVSSWFEKIKPIQDEDGEIAIQFTFHKDLRPHLLGLRKNFVQIGMDEFFPISGKHALRMYPAIRAGRDKQKHKNLDVTECALYFELDSLKAMLGLTNKYKALKDFKRRVLDPVVNEISECSSLFKVRYETVKSKRTVTGIKFIISDNIVISENILVEYQEDYVPSKEDIEILTWSQCNAYDYLKKKGVKEGIIYKQILPNIQAANMAGYEDLFIKKAFEIFKTKTKKRTNPEELIAIFVNWWTKKKIFDVKSDLYFQISEQVHFSKKSKAQEEIDNREIAKTMNKKAFQKWYKLYKSS